MKRNIDLTENSDFAIPIENRFPKILSFFHKSVLSKKINKYILDIDYCINKDIEYRQNGGIIQGDRSRREFVKFYEKSNYCERCGRSQKYPWKIFNSNLCFKCDELLKNEFHKIPWEEK